MGRAEQRIIHESEAVGLQLHPDKRHRGLPLPAIGVVFREIGAAGSDGAAKFEYAANVSIFEWSAHARG